MVEDTEEKILRDWNEAWSHSHRSMKSMEANTVDDIYRKVLGFAKAHGKPETAQAKASLNRSEDGLAYQDSLGMNEQGVISLRRAKKRPIKKEDHIGSRIMFEFLHRIRKWRKEKSTN